MVVWFLSYNIGLLLVVLNSIISLSVYTFPSMLIILLLIKKKVGNVMPAGLVHYDAVSLFLVLIFFVKARAVNMKKPRSPSHVGLGTMYRCFPFRCSEFF